MGEYYRWVNADKKQYIRPSDFGYGSKAWETAHRDSEPLLAMYELLHDEWKGDHIVWFGDEISLPNNPSNEVLKILDKDSIDFGYPHNAFDTICESYRNVSCFFMEASESVRENIEIFLYENKNVRNEFNEYGIDIEHPYDNLFKKFGRRYNYVINHSKKIFYSLDESKILYSVTGTEDMADPIFLFMSFGNRLGEGEWLGDIIGVSDDRPDNYTFLKEIILRDG